MMQGGGGKEPHKSRLFLFPFLPFSFVAFFSSWASTPADDVRFLEACCQGQRQLGAEAREATGWRERRRAVAPSDTSTHTFIGGRRRALGIGRLWSSSRVRAPLRQGSWADVWFFSTLVCCTGRWCAMRGGLTGLREELAGRGRPGRAPRKRAPVNPAMRNMQARHCGARQHVPT